MIFLGNSDDEGSFTPVVKAVEISLLIPTSYNNKIKHEKSLLYDKEILTNLMIILGIEVDENTSLVIR